MNLKNKQILNDQRIVFVVSAMETGGAERVAANLVNAYALRGLQMSLIVTYSGRGECHYVLDDRVELIYLSDKCQSYEKSWGGYLKRFLSLRSLLKARRPASVVSFLTNVNVATLVACLGLRMRVIVSERTHPPCFRLGWFWEWLRMLVYPLAYRVVMLTENGFSWLLQTIPTARGVVIPNPVLYPLPVGEPVLAVSDCVRAERKLLLAVGRLDEGKQFDQLLEAFFRLATRHADWDLVILGEGVDRERLRSIIARLDLNSRVRMPGRVGNVGDWYERADLYVMSSRFEGFPNTLLEAMAHGCAAVSYDCDTGPSDIIRHGVDGLLVRSLGDVSALAVSLNSLMADDVLREAIGSRAIEVRERFSVKKILDKWDVMFFESSQNKEV